VILPVNEQPIVLSVRGNKMELSVKDDDVALRLLSRRVCNIEQLKALQELKCRIRRMDEAIGQSLGRLAAIRNIWRLRETIPDSFERQDYDAQQKKLTIFNSEFITACTTLHQTWPLVAETGNEFHSWTLSLDETTVLFLPDLRPGKEGLCIEVRFWLGASSMPSSLYIPAADVTVVPDCLAPYRPFEVPAVWIDGQFECTGPVWDNISTKSCLRT
jgi:hypothetical protein